MLRVLHALFFFHLQAGESRKQEELGGMAQGKKIISLRKSLIFWNMVHAWIGTVVTTILYLFLFNFSCYQDKLYTKLVPYLLWALPVGVRNLPIYFKIFNYLEYDVWKMFDQERRRPKVIWSLRAASFSEILKYYIFRLHDLEYSVLFVKLAMNPAVILVF